MTFDSESGRRAKLQQEPYPGLEHWRIQTPLVLQRAIKACWDGTGTPAQKLLLSEWVTARVMRQPIPTTALRAALFAEQMEQRKENGSGTQRDRHQAGGLDVCAGVRCSVCGGGERVVDAS